MQRFVAILAAAILLMLPLRALPARADSPPIVLSRVLVGSHDNASDEYVVIYNNSDTEHNISGLTVEYKSATGKDWSKRATVADGTKLAAWQEYEFASVQTADAKLTPGLAQSGGNVRLFDSSGNELDRLAWGNGDSAQGTAVPAPSPGEEITRQRAAGSDTELQASGDNSADFTVAAAPGQGSAGDTSSDSAGDPSAVDQTDDAGLALQLNELLPDPVSPQTDSNDEFIELYNPNDATVNLNGWQLVDGGGKTYTFGDGAIAGHGYFVVYSKVDKLSLNNSGDTITLLAPDGNTIDTSPDYGNAKAGLSWGLTEDGWAWTQSPTPGGPNSAALSTDSSSSSKTSSKASAKKSAKASSTKKAAAKTSKAKPVANKTVPTNADDTAAKPYYNIWAWLLGAAGLATIGYGIYEYRTEIQTYYHKFRAKFRLGRGARAGH